MFSAVFGAILSAFNFIIGGIILMAGLITSGLLSLAARILNTVISTGFISLSYTNTTNPFISVGWELTRGLTNIIFVLALLAIGLGTALKMNDYQAKKALPLLIIIALLINFTPVILGIIVDGSNIAMNYFLSSGFQGGSIWASQSSALWEAWKPSGEGLFNPAVQMNNFMALLVITVFNVIAMFIFFIFAAIFLMRYVIIWLLVILSPIAFACYILPATRGIWKKWWTQFLQWTFVGVTAGFYLYLANQLMKLILIDKSVVFAAQGGEGLGLLNFILPWGVIIIFLILGLQAAMSSSAQGANFAINAVKGAPKKFASTKLGGRLVGEAASMAQRGLAGTSKFSEKHWAARPLGWMTKGIDKAVGGKLIEYAATKRRVSPPKGWDQMSVPEKEAYINTQTFGSDRTVLTSKMKNEGTLKHASKEFREARVKDAEKLALNTIYKKEVGDIMDAMPDKIKAKIEIDAEMDEGKKEELKKKIENFADELSQRALVDIKLADELGAEAKKRGLTKEQLADPTASREFLRDLAAAKMYVEKMKSGDVKGVNKGSLDSLAFRLGSQNFTPGHFQQIDQEFGKDGLEQVLTGAGGVGTLTADEFYKKNPGLFKSFMTNPVLSHIKIAARDQMKGPDDQKTRNWDTFERGQKIKKIFEQHFEIRDHDKNQKNKEKIQAEIQETEADLIKLRTEARTTKGFRKIDIDIEAERIKQERIVNDAKSGLQRLQTKIDNESLSIKGDAELNKGWQEIQELRKPKSKR